MKCGGDENEFRPKIIIMLIFLLIFPLFYSKKQYRKQEGIHTHTLSIFHIRQLSPSYKLALSRQFFTITCTSLLQKALCTPK